MPYLVSVNLYLTVDPLQVRQVPPGNSSSSDRQHGGGAEEHKLGAGDDEQLDGVRESAGEPGTVIGQLSSSLPASSSPNTHRILTSHPQILTLLLSNPQLILTHPLLILTSPASSPHPHLILPQPIYAGTVKLNVNKFSKKQASQSKGAMGGMLSQQTQTSAEPKKRVHHGGSQ